MMNVGGVDRILRALLGIVLLVISFKPEMVGLAGTGVVPWVMMAVGAILLLTAAVRFCPLYPLIGLNTCPVKK